MFTRIDHLMRQVQRFRFLKPGQLSELQRARSIINAVADPARDDGDELLAHLLYQIAK